MYMCNGAVCKDDEITIYIYPALVKNKVNQLIDIYIEITIICYLFNYTYVFFIL